jgi:hypothetical protein
MFSSFYDVPGCLPKGRTNLTMQTLFLIANVA